MKHSNIQWIGGKLYRKPGFSLEHLERMGFPVKVPPEANPLKHEDYFKVCLVFDV